MKKRALVTGGSSNQSFAIGTFLINIKEKCPKIADEFVIFHDGKMLERDMQLMSQIVPTRFIQYRVPPSVSAVVNQGAASHFTPMLFCKFECLKLLNDYEAVGWSDYDVVLLDDISEVFNSAESLKMLLMENSAYQSFLIPIDEYDMNSWGMSAALFVLRDSLQYNEMYDFCYKMLCKYGNNLFMPEQAIFNIMLQEFSLTPGRLPHCIYVPHPKDHAQNPHAKILHAYGSPKFWDGLENEIWRRNYAQWCSMGGSIYKPQIDDRRMHRRILSKIKKIILSFARVI